MDMSHSVHTVQHIGRADCYLYQFGDDSKLEQEGVSQQCNSQQASPSCYVSVAVKFPAACCQSMGRDEGFCKAGVLLRTKVVSVQYQHQLLLLSLCCPEQYISSCSVYIEQRLP